MRVDIGGEYNVRHLLAIGTMTRVRVVGVAHIDGRVRQPTSTADAREPFVVVEVVGEPFARLHIVHANLLESAE